MSFWNWIFGRKPAPSHETNTIRPRGSSSGARIEWRKGSFPLDAVGESNYQRALERICGGHSRDGHEVEVEADLVREPDNPYDSNAVGVRIEGATVGYLPRDQAARVSAQMVTDGIEHAGCMAKIVGGWRTNQYDEGYFGVRLAIPRQGWIDFGIGKEKPQIAQLERAERRSSKRPEPAQNGPLAGEWIVLWGADGNGPEAKELAGLGARIMAGIGKSTTMVVHLGDEVTPGMEASTTFRKIEERRADGDRLELISIKDLRNRDPG